MCLSGGEPEFLEVAEAIGSLGELLVLTPGCLYGLDLGHRLPKLIGLPRPPIALSNEQVELGLIRLPPREDRLIVAQDGGDSCPREPVERFTLGGRRAQPNLVRLSVHDHELVAELVQDAHRCATAAHHRPTATLLGNRPAEDQFAVVQVAAGIAHPLGHRATVVQKPPTLDDRLGAS